MGTGYTRNDTANNIADGNVINAADFDGEYDAIESAFNATTGHTHDGTAAEGGPITVVGPVQDVVVSSTEMRPKTTNTLDLGTSSLEYKDLHLSGTANLVNVTTTGDVTLTGAANNVVFDASDNALEFADNAKGVFGTGSDLQLYHDGTNSYIENNTGELLVQGDGITLRSDTGAETYIAADLNGAVELYYDNSKKFETTSTGVAITGSLAVDSLHLDDNEKLTFGNSASADLEIYHDATDSYIENNTGELYIQGNNITLRSDTGTETFVAMDVNGAVELYHNNVKKLDTDADGVNVTGQIDVSTNANISGNISVLSDSGAIKLGASEEVTLTHVHNVGVTLNVENTTTNAVTDVLKVQAQSSGTPAVGIGTGIEFSTETASGTLETGGVVESVTTGLTPGSEEFDLIFKTMSSGAAAAERLKLNASGATVGNVNVNGNTISSTNTNGNIVVAPNGTGDVQLDADTVRVGDSNADVTVTTNGTGDLTLNTNSGTNSGVITIADGSNGNIAITPNGTGEVDISKVDIDGGAIDGTIIGANSAAAGTFTSVAVDNITIDGNSITSTNTGGNIALTPDGTGDVQLDADTIRVGDSNANATITTNGTGDLILNTNAGTDSGSITIADAANGAISIVPNGTGNVTIGNLEFDADATKTDNHVLTYDATGGTIQLEAIPAQSLSSDTSPTLGGTLTADGFNIEFDDSAAATDDRLRFGTGNDLQLYHNGTDSFIDNTTGSLRIQHSGTNVLDVTAAKVAITGRAVGSQSTDIAASSGVITMDLSAHNNFEVSCADADEITFSNQSVGQSGNIFFDKTGSAQPTVNAIVAINATSLTALATEGVYHLTYYVKAASGDNSILVSVSGKLE